MSLSSRIEAIEANVSPPGAFGGLALKDLTSTTLLGAPEGLEPTPAAKRFGLAVTLAAVPALLAEPSLGLVDEVRLMLGITPEIESDQKKLSALLIALARRWGFTEQEVALLRKGLRQHRTNQQINHQPVS
jgi:hypothetical protein